MNRDKQPEQVTQIEVLEIDSDDQNNKNKSCYDILDDALYMISKSNVVATQASPNKVQNVAQKPKIVVGAVKS